MKINKKHFTIFIRFLKLLFPFRKRWLLILLLSVSSMLLGLVNPYLAKIVVDGAIRSKDVKFFIILVLIGGGGFVIKSLIDGFQKFLIKFIKIKLRFDLNKKVFRKLQHFAYGWFQANSTGGNLYSIHYDIERVTEFITTTPHTVSLFFQIIFTLVIVIFLNWKMAIFSLCLAPFLYIPSYYFSRKMRNVWKVLIENSQEIFKTLGEFFSHILLVKSFGKEASGARKFLRQLIINIRLETSNVKLEIGSSFFGGFLTKLIMGIIIFYGGLQVIKGQMTLGSFTAIMVYLGQLIGSHVQFAYFFQKVAIGLVSCERVAAILDESETIDSRDAISLIVKNARIDFRSVSFGYRPEVYVLKDLTFFIDAGKHIVIAGPSGCGKTTIINLILRLFRPWQGDILIDGYNIQNITRSSLIRNVGIALQEPFLWNDSIENNIRYGREESTLEEIARVAKFAGVDDFVKYLPQGYQTVIGENACKISEGQKQKIAIARALIKNPKILILDEAMSSMDSESEEIILSNIKKNLIGTTLITVSHRLSTVIAADLVYYLMSPHEIIVDNPRSLANSSHGFSDLFIGQNKI